MWQRDADRYEAAQHERQVRSVTRVMLPMIDVASLVERTPEVDRRRAAQHERLAQAIAGHEVVAEETPGVMRRLATWVVGHLEGLLRRRVSSQAAGRR